MNSDAHESWYRVCKSKALKDKPLSLNLNGIPIVLFRGKEGKPGALLDRCPHRNIPMSKGYVENENLVCRHHGWHFNTEGTCVKIAQLKVIQEDNTRNAFVFNSVEADGFIYVNCDASPGQFPQIKAKPAEIKYVVPQPKDARFFQFIVKSLMVITVFLILIFIWFKLVPLYLFDGNPII